jgi:hypothetical protein
MHRAIVNPFEFKDLPALIPLLGAIFTYWTYVKTRLDWISEKRKRVGDLGYVHWFVDVLPNRILTIVFTFVLLSSLAYFYYKFFVDPSDTKLIARILRFNYDNFYLVFAGWIVFVILAYFNIIPKVFENVAGRIPAMRETIGFANASWHNELEAEAPALAIGNTARAFVDEVVQDLAVSPPNENLALRPPNVSDAEAANILYFGHVVEAYQLHVPSNGPRTGWTAFYEVMGLIANDADRPFSPEFIRNFDIDRESFFYKVLKRFDAYAGYAHPRMRKAVTALPNAQQLEEAIDKAFRHLKEIRKADARNIGKGWWWFSYDAALRNIGDVLQPEELRRQFAKLALVWHIWSSYRRPSTFRIPFSRGIVILFLEKNFFVTDADEFSTADPRFQTCMEQGVRELLQIAYQAIEQTHNDNVVKWRDAEQLKARQLGIDWSWYLFYRVDQHVYHLGRTHERTEWNYRGGTSIIEKGKKT